ncbi:DUF695 domain-containing protein [Chryseobacterium sp. EO14]|uniref:DUF695 domain-containing protein n=1 Tax=Chryseobacterium sp. EO14 TaxID=2950551 RepID=UPI002108644E|nr:DUF695 domain-containing protein [Chryseobacterium sp. EO14]MCQ4142565.1 DUF695 domain-containing protein [Chryseobacterium sp. EO14]
MTEDLRNIITEQDEWSIAEGENNQHLFILRFRPHLLPFVKTQKYNNRLIVLLEYKTITSDLLPSDDQLELFERIENDIITEIENNLSSVLAFVYTGNGKREWHFYTQNIQEAEQKINKVLDRINYSETIQLQEEEDPEWHEYHSVLLGTED